MKIDVGCTTTGKAILIDGKPQRKVIIENDFKDFSDREAFDAFLVAEYLSLRELRKGMPDAEWFHSLLEVRDNLRERLDHSVVAALMGALGITSAFAARDYGQTLVHPHFRSL